MKDSKMQGEENQLEAHADENENKLNCQWERILKKPIDQAAFVEHLTSQCIADNPRK